MSYHFYGIRGDGSMMKGRPPLRLRGSYSVFSFEVDILPFDLSLYHQVRTVSGPFAISYSLY